MRPRRRPTADIDPRTGLPLRGSYFRCICGKLAFVTRKAARASLKRTFPGETMQVYRCDRAPVTSWHYGHPYGHERGA